MNLNKIFTSFVIGFLIWIFFGNVLFFMNYIFYFLLIIWVLSIVFLFYIKRYQKYFLIAIIWVFLWCFYSGINNYFINHKQIEINNYFDKKIVLNAKIIDLYKVWEDKNIYELNLLNIWNTNFQNINFLMTIPNNLILEKNTQLEIEWKILKIDNFSQNFDYKNFLLSKDIYFSMYYPKINYFTLKQKTGFLLKIDNLKKHILNTISQIYPKNESSLLAWILIWEKQWFSKELMISYNNAWLTHLIAVSWYNITIIIIFVWLLFKVFPIYVRAFFIVCTILFFVLLVWNNPSVIRASIMWIVGYFIMISWRNKDSFAVVLGTMFVMILFNPMYLNYDTSFILSFLAVLWLLFTQNFWNNLFRFFPKFFAIKESFVLTMSSLSTTLPIMIFGFGKVSLVSPLTNMLVWWVMPFAMFFWFLSILWQLINDKIWYILWYFSYFILRFINNVALFFWWLSFWVFCFDFKEIWVYLEILYFMILIFLILYFKQEKKPI